MSNEVYSLNSIKLQCSAIVGFRLVTDETLMDYPAQVSIDIRARAPRAAPGWVQWGPMDEQELKRFLSALECPEPKVGKGRGKGRGKGGNKSRKAPPNSEHLKSEEPGKPEARGSGKSPEHEPEAPPKPCESPPEHANDKGGASSEARGSHKSAPVVVDYVDYLSVESLD